MHYITHNNYTVQEYIMFFFYTYLIREVVKKTDIESLIQIDNQQIYFLFPWLVQEVMILKLQTVGSCWNIGLQVLINEGYKSGRAIGI